MAKAGFPAVAIPASAQRDVQIAVQNIRARLEALESLGSKTQTVNAQIASLSAQIAALPTTGSSSGPVSLTFEELTDVKITSVAAAQVPAWNTTDLKWENTTLALGKFTASASAPGSPNVGDRWVNTSNGVQYTWFNDGSGNQWVQFT